MTAPRRPTPRRIPDPVDYGPDDDQDPLAYLEQGAIVPPRTPLQLRRLHTRRSLVGAGMAAIGLTAWFGVPLNTDGAFFPGTTVHDLSIAELDRPHALALMQAHFADFENTAVDFNFEQQVWNASLAQMGYAIDYDATLDAAWQHGRTSSRINQFASVIIRPDQKSFPVIFTRDETRLRAYLSDIGTQIIGAARDAMLYLDADRVRIRPNEDGRELDIEGAIIATDRVIQGASRGTVQLTAQPVVSQITAERLEPKREMAQTMINAPIRLDTGDETWTVPQSTLRTALVLPAEGVLTDPTFDENIIGQSLAEMSTATATQPVNATLGWDDGLIVVTEDIKGRELDLDGTVAAIVTASRTADVRTIDAVFTPILADIRADNTDELGIIDLVGSGDSNFDGSSWERAENVRISAGHLTHTLVNPGGTYSFNQAIGPITLANGFVEGKIIRGNWIVTDIGGGACQASTTVFRAALKAGLPISHTAHTYRLAFYEQDGWSPGLDAAIYQPNEGSNDWETDLTFVNTTENWLLVEFYTEGVRAYCHIYGTPPGWDVAIEVPYISEPEVPGDPVETESDTLDKGERQQVGWATNGYDVQAVRTITENGELVSFESQSNPWEFWSEFKAQRDEYLIGPGTERLYDKNGTPTPPAEG